MSYARHPDCQRALQLAGSMAEAARRTALQYFRQPLAVETKDDRSPVTIADRSIELELRRMIRAEFPDHGIDGEEFAAESGNEFTWVIDPIDGTKSFISGFPLFGTLVALKHRGRAVLGLIEAPAMGERWTGIEGGGSLFNSVPAHTSSCTSIEQACIYTTSTDQFPPDAMQRYERYSRRARMRRFGGDCYLYGMLASGHCDLVAETGLQPHDFLALIPIIEGAGGRISDWEGCALTDRSGDRVLAAATEALWREAVAALAGCSAVVVK